MHLLMQRVSPLQVDPFGCDDGDDVPDDAHEGFCVSSWISSISLNLSKLICLICHEMSEPQPDLPASSPCPSTDRSRLITTFFSHFHPSHPAVAEQGAPFNTKDTGPPALVYPPMEPSLQVGLRTPKNDGATVETVASPSRFCSMACFSLAISMLNFLTRGFINSMRASLSLLSAKRHLHTGLRSAFRSTPRRFL